MTRVNVADRYFNVADVEATCRDGEPPAGTVMWIW